MNLLIVLMEINWTGWLPVAAYAIAAFILGWLARHILGGNKQKTALLQNELTELKTKHQAVIVESINRYESLENKYIRLQGNYTTAVTEASKLSDALVKIKELSIALEDANRNNGGENTSERKEFRG
jgi:hypothetical protein